MPQRLQKLGLGLLLGLTLPAAQAAIYRWTGDDGQVHYGETPPPGRSAEQVRVWTDTPSPDTDGAAEEAAATFDATIEARAKAREAAAEQAAKAAEAAERCAAAKSRVSYFENRPPIFIFVKDDQGEQARMTEEQHAEQLAEARRRADILCKD